MSSDIRLMPNRLLPGLIVLVSVSAIAGSILCGTPLQSANDRSRWATVWSLIHRRTWQIDEIDQDPRWTTIDKVRHRESDEEPWHFYSSKPPLLSTIAAGVYGAQRRTLGADLRRDTLPVTRVTLLLINGLPMALALWMFQRLLMRLNLSLECQCFVLLVAGFGSMLNPYLTTLNNHTPAAVCLLICLMTIVRIQQNPEQLRSRDFVVVGLTAALTSCFELPAALFGAVSFFWMLRIDVRRTLLWYVPAALLPLFAFFLTNWLVTGGIRPFYAFYGTDKYVYVHQGVPSYWSNPQDLDANQEGTLTYLLHCLLGHHGLLSHTPVFVLSILGWLTMRRLQVRPGLRGVLPVGAAISAVVLCFYLSRTQNYNYGGNSAALRWMLWLTPFWWFALIGPVERLFQTGRGRIVACILLAASVLTATMSLAAPWRPSWIYVVMEQAGWINYRTPIEPFVPERHSVFADWPEVPGMTGVWQVDGGADTLTLTVRGADMRDGQECCVVDVMLETGGPEPVQKASCLILLDSFAAGEPVSRWLRGDDASAQAPQWLAQLLQGLPTPRAYTAAGVRWLRPTSSSVGYRCERGASRVRQNDAESGDCWYRCDVWYCGDVPFGVLRWKQTVSQVHGGEVLRVRTWTAQSPE